MKRLLGSLVLLALVALGAAAPAVADDPPQTGFETSAGANWTTHDEEVAFLEAVDAQSDRVVVTEIGRTLQDRPVHLVAIGDPVPRAAAEARSQPTSLFICSQHGNEPAGREACLRWLRDLAFTDDPVLLRQLREQTILFVPAANPDGRAANSRGNSQGEDINRDHIDLSSAEAQAIAGVVRDWAPDITVDLHEFGPSIPTLYDDDLLYLWPRNLNADPQVRYAARTLAEQYVAKGAEAHGERAGEYGRYRTMIGDYHVTQTAGDEDEGIARNAFGLRHSGGLLLETRVDGSPFHGVDDMLEQPNRRVNTHYQAVADSLRFMRDQGDAMSFINDNAAERKTREGAEASAPVYFNGQDEDGTLDGSGQADPTSIADPPPCGYLLSAEQVDTVGLAMSLHGISVNPRTGGGAFVSMAQPAEPVIPLLLDPRGNRNAVDGEALTTC